MYVLNGEKNSLRASLRRLRDSAPDCAARDGRIFASLRAFPPFSRAKAVLCYVSTGSEADTRLILTAALEEGKNVFVPRCASEGRMDFFRIADLSDLRPGKFGILEPEDRAALRWTDGDALCLVPGLGFTESGARIGYGGGYYDRFLLEKNVLQIGLCYDFQILPAVPEEAHDVRMDWIVTDTRIIRCPRTVGNGKGEDERE